MKYQNIKPMPLFFQMLSASVNIYTDIQRHIKTKCDADDIIVNEFNQPFTPEGVGGL